MRERLDHVRARIADACDSAGRSTDKVTLVAISKTHPAPDVLEAVRCGVMDFGENRPEVARPKLLAVREALAAGDVHLRWHMVGHIQSRKARLVIPDYALIHSVDSVKLAGKLSSLSVEAAVRTSILLEVNVSGEDTKSGWGASNWRESATVRESLWNDIRSILTFTGLKVEGLMTMAPIVPDAELARPTFAALRGLRDALAEEFPQADWQHLSMGMSDDFPVAIAEGATIVRIGRAIFGPRLD